MQPLALRCLLAAAPIFTGAAATLSSPQALADQVHAAFLGFVRDQDPGWPPYNQSKSIKVFDAKSAVVTEGYESARALRDAGH